MFAPHVWASQVNFWGLPGPMMGLFLKTNLRHLGWNIWLLLPPQWTPQQKSKALCRDGIGVSNPVVHLFKMGDTINLSIVGFGFILCCWEWSSSMRTSRRTPRRRSRRSYLFLHCVSNLAMLSDIFSAKNTKQNPAFWLNIYFFNGFQLFWGWEMIEQW